jgi:hypothetical protein
MDLRKFLSDRLLQYPEGNGDGLQVLGTGSDVDVDRLETCVVDDGFLDERAVPR